MPEGISSRLRFVDGDEGEGLWSTATDVLPKYADGVRCAHGGVAFFKWKKAWKTHPENPEEKDSAEVGSATIKREERYNSVSILKNATE